MEPSSSHFDTSETLKLFIPVKRLLDSYIGSTDPPLLTKGFITDPILSVDLDKDVIIQTAFIRRSYEEENEFLPDFILEDTLPPCWSTSNATTYFNSLASTLSIDLPVDLLGIALGMTCTGDLPPEPKQLARSDHLEHLLSSFNAHPTPTVAITILSCYASNFKAIYDYLKQISDSLPSARPLSIANEDVMWNLPQKPSGLITTQIRELPRQIPTEIISHLNRLLAASQVDLLPISVFTSSVAQWIPEDVTSLEAPLADWAAEMRHLAHLFYQQRQIRRV